MNMNFSKLGLVLRGMAMGIAEVIPGVSGGTIAFITGIYKTLLDSIKAVDHNFLKLLFKFRLGEMWSRLNGNFLLWLFAGMIAGILIGVFGVTYLLEHYPEVLWGLFFGLILASVPLMLSQMKEKTGISIVLFILGAFIAYAITSLSPSEGSTNYMYVFVAGVIAISALVLPGISGSFILLLMGLYTTIIPTLKSFLKTQDFSDFSLLAVFGLGCITGLVVFSRIVSAAFEKYHDPTIALLSGFMLGSLNKIWPWRNPLTILNKDNGSFISLDRTNISEYNFLDEGIKIVKENNVFPADYFFDSRLPMVIIAFILGLILIFLLSRSGLIKASSTS